MEENGFFIKGGICTLQANKITITYTGTNAGLRRWYNDIPMALKQVLLALLVITFAHLATDAYMMGYSVILVGLYALLGMFILLVLIRTYKQSTAGKIPLSSIKRIEYKQGSQAYFIIHFKNAGGRMRKRVLRFSKNNAGVEAARALGVFRSAGLIA